MKCPNCGAEIENAKFCEFCGSQVTAEMQRAQEQINKTGCPKCGSSNIAFRRENQGEVRGKKSKQIIHRTVGYCKDCGETWYTDNEPKKRKTWLWVLGWIFVFPVPLTIILLKKKDMNKIAKYVIIAVAWVIYLLIAIAGNSGGNSNAASEEPSNNNDLNSFTENITTTDSITTSEISVTAAADHFRITNGTQGEFGKVIKLDVGTEFEREVIEYHIPVGTYEVYNTDSSSAIQLSVYKNGWVKNDNGYDEASGIVGNPIVLAAGKKGEITVVEDSYVKLADGNEILEFTLIK
ncbi:MAG: YgiT-type zinc finger protein [Clostridia bacterium]|nr:YgiT-type zinc finger protein [Clostridia bacterium]